MTNSQPLNQLVCVYEMKVVQLATVILKLQQREKNGKKCFHLDYSKEQPE